MDPNFSRLIMVDWSAANKPGPPKPAENRCWVGRLDPGQEGEPTVCYARTRAKALDLVEQWTAEVDGRVLIGFDFPFGYPDYPAKVSLPTGRDLCRELAGLVKDGPDDRNNRFHVAAALNRRLNPNGEGPFWGLPQGHAIEGLRATKSNPWPKHIPEFRLVECNLKGMGIQSVWKLAYPASVGSQALVGLTAIGRLLDRPAFEKARLWPFETGWDEALGAVTIAEIWPRLFYHNRAWKEDARVKTHHIRDAGQVAATLIALAKADCAGQISAMLRPQEDLPLDEREKAQTREGWIIGA